MSVSELKDFRGKRVKIIVADSKKDCTDLIGKFASPDDYSILVSEDTNCYVEPNCDVSTQADCEDKCCAECGGGVNEDNVAFIFRKNWFSEEYQKWVYEGLKDAATPSDNRGMAAGVELIEEGYRNMKRATKVHVDILEYMMNPTERIDGGDTIQEILDSGDTTLMKERWVGDRVDEGFVFEEWLKEAKKLPVSEMIDEARRVYSWIGETGYANQVHSGVAGFYDRYPRFPFLRETSYTANNKEKFEKSFPFLSRLNEGFKALLPNRWKAQKAAADKLDSKYLIGDTVFTTLTVNSRFRTAYHLDAGDLAEGFSNLCVVSNNGNYSGGYLTFPEYRIAVDVRPGDLLLVANHTVIHGNQEFVFHDEEADRVSIVAYFRGGMLKGGTRGYEEYRKKFVELNREDKSLPFWKTRFNGVYPGMWCDNDADNPESAKRWYEFLKKHEKGDEWLEKYHPKLKSHFENRQHLDEFF